MLAEKIDLSQYSASFLLEQYVLWFKSGRSVRLGYPAKCAFASGIAESRDALSISDDEAVTIDDVLSKMRSSSKMKMSTDVLIDYYQFGRYGAVAHKHKITYSAARELVMKAENRFAGLVGICD